MAISTFGATTCSRPNAAIALALLGYAAPIAAYTLTSIWIRSAPPGSYAYNYALALAAIGFFTIAISGASFIVSGVMAWNAYRFEASKRHWRVNVAMALACLGIVGWLVLAATYVVFGLLNENAI